MPDFYPSISQVKTIRVPPDARTGYVHLNFFAVFDHEEQPQGQWEIWTDLPFDDDQGNPPSHLGEWRAKAFHAVAVPKGAVNGVDKANGVSTTSITIRSLDLPEPSLPPATLSTTLVISVELNRDFAYTFRHVHPDGHIHWQSGMGGNGVVRLKASDKADETGPIKSGPYPPYDDVFEDSLDWDWSGIAVTLHEGKKRIQTPRLNAIPHKGRILPTLVLLHGPPTPHLAPFARLSSTKLATPSEDASASYQAIISPIDNPLIQFGKLPTIGMEGWSPTYALGVDTTPTEVLRAAVGSAKRDQSHLLVAEVKQGKETSQNVGALFYISSEGDSEPTQVIVDAVYHQAARDIAIEIPDRLSGHSPLLIVSSDSSSIPSYVPGRDNNSARHIPAHIYPGAAADVLRVSEFFELRGAGADDTIWIAVPGANSAELGEKEVEIHSIDPVDNPAYFDITKDLDVQSNNVLDGFVTPQTELVPPRSATVPSSTDRKKQGGSWILGVIARFFESIWRVILWPFRSKIVPPRIETEDTNGQTITDERTPLLGSRSTASTAATPGAAPPNPQTPMLSPIPHTVAIRSYARLTFNATTPLRFFLPPGSASVEERLKFTFKSEEGKDWEDLKVDVKRHGEGKVLEGLADVKLKEIMIERI
ncbi:hypothetical protein L198_05998 [Cryptococcus wingfieldii CBS 7118]|uniref:Uncharacterized protein n=1 Tax=Cryptococcus wingfieldii CBS 7118 TaxID=1295528 RepID=A0A1E3ISG9_9TREE|nr:hypothetical protein L198_05998 [Cryptococcus wingfieldii CBS 7118]ODN91478.1 hypothetical protein L198_05998 [Cryptococcus wingfieldii CBS 7118]